MLTTELFRPVTIVSAAQLNGGWIVPELCLLAAASRAIHFHIESFSFSKICGRCSGRPCRAIAVAGGACSFLQRMFRQAQVGDLQRRLDTGADVQKRLQSLEEFVSHQRSSNDERMKVLSSELQQSTHVVMQQLEQHLSSLEEATKQQSVHTESTLKSLSKKVEDSLQSAALEISDAALQNLLREGEKMRRFRHPVPQHVVRQAG